MKTLLTAAAAIITPMMTIAPLTAVAEPAPSIVSGETIYTDSTPSALDPLGLYSAGRENICTLGIVLNNQHALTASHCGSVGQVVSDDYGPIGTIKGFQPGKDIAVIELNQQRPIEITPVDPSLLKEGAHVWKQGHTTGRTEGTVIGGRENVTVHGKSIRDQLGIQLGSLDSLGEIVDPTPSLTTVAVPTNMCVAPGDPALQLWLETPPSVSSPLYRVIVAPGRKSSAWSYHSTKTP